MNGISLLESRPHAAAKITGVFRPKVDIEDLPILVTA